MKRCYVFQSWIGLLVLLWFSSCGFDDINFDNIAQPEVSPDIAVNLGEATFTLGEFIGDLESDQVSVQTDDEFQIHLIVQEQIRFDNIDDIITIGTVTNDAEFHLPLGIPALPFEQTIPFDQLFVFEFEATEDQRVDSVYFKGGSLDYQMLSDFPASIDYDWQIFKTRTISNNQDLTRSNSLNYNGINISDSYSTSLDGIKTIVDIMDNVNTFNVNLVGDFILAPGIELTTAQGLYFTLTYQNPEFSSIYGFFGEQEMADQEFEFALDLFDDFDPEGLTFTDPRISLEVVNSFGIEFLLNMDNITAVPRSGEPITLVSTLDDSDRLIRAPRIVGQTETSVIEINREVSNLDELISEIPESFVFNVSAIANPEISDLASNFLTDSSFIEINAEVDIPLNVTLHDFEVDFEVATDGIGDIDGAESLEVQITTTNEIPFNGTIQLQFIDEQGMALATLDDLFEIQSPIVTGDRVEEAMVTVSTVSLDEVEIDALLNSSEILATVRVSTFESEVDREVVLFEDYELKIEVGLRGEIVVEL